MILHLNQRLRLKRNRREQKYLKKIYRESSAYVRRKTWHRFQVWDRNLDTEAMGRFLADPDHFISRGKLLKDGKTSTVALVTVDHRPLVVKRYNMKNLWHRLKRCPRPSRAWHSWAEAHRLGLQEIPTPRPVAFMENRWGPLRATAYFVTEYAPGMDVRQWFHSENRNPNKDQKIITAFARMMQHFFKARITHGDLKATNFIFSDGELFVIDLDAMRAHRWAGPMFRRRFKKDCCRLLQNWNSLPEVKQKFRKALKSLC